MFYSHQFLWIKRLDWEATHHLRLPRWLSGKASTCQAGDTGLTLGWKDPLEKEINSS